MQPEDILFLLRLHIRVLTATNRRISQLNQVRLRRSIRIRENLDPQPGYWEAFPWDPVPPNREVTGYELTLQTGDGPANLALDHQLWLPRVIRFPHVPHFVGRLASAVVHRAQHVFDRVRGRPPAPPPELPDHVVEERLGGVVDALRAHPPRNFWDNQLPEGGGYATVRSRSGRASGGSVRITLRLLRRPYAGRPSTRNGSCGRSNGPSK